MDDGPLGVTESAMPGVLHEDAAEPLVLDGLGKPTEVLPAQAPLLLDANRGGKVVPTILCWPNPTPLFEVEHGGVFVESMIFGTSGLNDGINSSNPYLSLSSQKE